MYTSVKKFGKNIKHYRHEAELTQQELANKSGLTTAAISMIENGLREPTLKTVVRLTRVLRRTTGVTFEKLTS